MNLRTSILSAFGAAALLTGAATVVAEQGPSPQTTEKLAKALQFHSQPTAPRTRQNDCHWIDSWPTSRMKSANITPIS